MVPGELASLLRYRDDDQQHENDRDDIFNSPFLPQKRTLYYVALYIAETRHGLSGLKIVIFEKCDRTDFFTD